MAYTVPFFVLANFSHNSGTLFRILTQLWRFFSLLLTNRTRLEMRKLEMSGIVIYDSKYGHTKDIAHFIGHEMQLPVHRIDTVNHIVLADYNPIIFATPVYIEHIAMAKQLNEMVPYLLDKTMYCLTVGAHTKDPSYFASLLDSNIAPEVQRHVHFYQIEGAITVDQLRSAHKFMLWFMKRFNNDKMDFGFADDVTEESDNKHNLVELNDRELVQIMNNIRAHQVQTDDQNFINE